MIDKSKRTATAEQSGNMIVIRMKGGPDCLWMNMYLDTQDWQMTCDSDIGFYAYHWGRGAGRADRDFLGFCIDWLSDENWLLRKCIDEQHMELGFDAEKSKKELMRMFIEDNGEGCDTYDFVEALEAADGYSDNAKQWGAALNTICDRLDVTLPDEWWECVVEDYTPWQRRFAEICRELIVPELLKLTDRKDGDGA